MKKIQSFFYVLCGAFLLGMLWRFRGTHGWGSGWGVLACGFVFMLFLTAVLNRPQKSQFPALCIAAFSFMLTTPGWGTFLDSLTGVLTVSSKSIEETLQAFVSPVSAVILMLCLGFGLASVFGVLCGKYFGGKAWRLMDYIILLIVFVAVGEIAKATVSHVLLRLIEPQAADLFAQGLQKAGVTDNVYAVYMSHYGNMNWAKKIIGGRHYFACISTISFVLQAIAVLITTRLRMRDRFAARTGAVVCGSFAVSITVSDLFFYFSNGGYHMRQGLSLPENMAAWSMWEYCTGFLAGGLITAYLISRTPKIAAAESEQNPYTIHNKFLQNKKLRSVTTFLLCFVGAVGLNTVRPILLRLDESSFQIPAAVITACIVLAGSILLCRKYGVGLESVDYPAFTGVLCYAMVLWYSILYMLFPEAQIRAIGQTHNCLVLISFVFMNVWLIVWRISNRKKA